MSVCICTQGNFDILPWLSLPRYGFVKLLVKRLQRLQQPVDMKRFILTSYLKPAIYTSLLEEGIYYFLAEKKATEVYDMCLIL